MSRALSLFVLLSLSTSFLSAAPLFNQKGNSNRLLQAGRRAQSFGELHHTKASEVATTDDALKSIQQVSGQVCMDLVKLTFEFTKAHSKPFMDEEFSFESLHEILSGGQYAALGVSLLATGLEKGEVEKGLALQSMQYALEQGKSDLIELRGQIDGQLSQMDDSPLRQAFEAFFNKGVNGSKSYFEIMDSFLAELEKTVQTVNN